MFYIETTATKKIRKLTKRLRFVQGGTSASKTVSINMDFIDKSQRDKDPTTTSIVSESMPHLKRGAMKDFLDIMKKHKYYKEDRWNRTDSIYTFETDSTIEFFSVDESSKVHGPRRDRLFINEANNIPFNTFEMLEVRTKEIVICDWNPVSEFWFHEEIEGNRDDYDFLVLTYKDNEALDPAIVASIEQRRHRRSWWKVYGEGLLGEAEGRIYTGWKIIDKIPHEARLERYGLDFGYTNDPTSLTAIYFYNGGYIFDEIVYKVGMKNREIADTILAQEQQAVVIADSAEPKSIDEIKERGINIVGAKKGPGSVNEGIDKVQDQKCSVTKRSLNIIKEYRGYLWEVDRDGNVTNEPMDFNNHAMSGIRYGLSSKLMSSGSMQAIFDSIEQPKVFDSYGNPITN